jgi:adhesin transport system outer membrane protein
MFFLTVLGGDRMKKILFLSLWIVFMRGAAHGGEIRLTLTEAIQMAQKRSYGVNAARGDAAAADFDYKSTRALRYPTLSVNSTVFYIDETHSLNLSFISKEIGSKENYQTDVKLSETLFSGGKISNQIKMQRAAAESKRFLFEAEKDYVAYQTRAAYLALMSSDYALKSAEASLKRLEIILRDVQNMNRVGMADSIDILDAESARQKAVRQVIEKGSARKNSRYRLTQLIGAENDDEIIPIEAPAVPTLPPGLPDSAVDMAEIELDRSELRAARNKTQAAGFLAAINRGGYFPNLIGYLGYSVGMPNRDQFNKDWNDYFSVGLGLNWEFNLGGKVKNSYLAAEQSLYAAEMSEKKLAESFTFQALIAAENLRSSYSAYQVSRNEFAIAEEKYRLASEKRKAGSLSVNRLLEMEAELTSAEMIYQAAIINYYLSETEYLYAVGADKIYGGL